jgi:predicted secreted protein
MTLLTGFAIYFIIWWLTLFLVLPYGIRSQAEADDIAEGTDPGAPMKTYLGRKLVINTLLAGLIFSGWFVLTRYYGLDLSTLPSIFPQDR